MSQMALAEKIGVSYQQVQKYEKGKDNISLSRLKQLTDALDVSAMGLIEEELGVSENRSHYGSDELNLIRLYRTLKSKRLKNDIIDMLKTMTRLQINK
jgi:transcriptional regulator with XRE-family HTH domain